MKAQVNFDELGGGGSEVNPSTEYYQIGTNGQYTWTNIDTTKHYIYTCVFQTSGNYTGQYVLYQGTLTPLYENNVGSFRIEVQDDGTSLYTKNNSGSNKLCTLLTLLD